MHFQIGQGSLFTLHKKRVLKSTDFYFSAIKSRKNQLKGLPTYVARPRKEAVLIFSFQKPGDLGGGPENREGGDGLVDENELMFQRLFPTETDKQKIFGIFEKIKTGLPVNSQELGELRALPDQVRFYLYFEEKNPIQTRKGFLKKGDVIEFLITLKLKTVTLTSIQNLVIQGEKGKQTLVIPRKGDELGAAPLLTKNLKLLFSVKKSDNNWSDSETIYNIGSHIVSSWLGHMLNDQVLIERFQLKRRSPFEAVTPRRTVGFGGQGFLDHKTDGVSERLFIFNLNSSLLAGDSDSYTLRIPFTSKRFSDLNYVPITLPGGSPLVTSVCKNWKKPITILDSFSETEERLESLTLQLSVESQKLAQKGLFGPVDFISPSGFTSNAKKSFTKLYTLESEIQEPYSPVENREREDEMIRTFGLLPDLDKKEENSEEGGN